MRWIQQCNTSFLDTLAKCITFFGEETIAIVIVALFYYAINKEFGKKLIYIVLASNMLNGVIKNFVKAPRPIGEEGIRSLRTETATGYSFPSGHSQSAAALYPTIVRKRGHHWLHIITGVLIFLIALSRLYLGVHYPIDVIVGVALGLLISYGGYYLYDKVKTNRLLLITALVMLPFAVVFLIQNNPLYADFFKSYGMYLGAALAFSFESRFVNFDTKVVFWKKVVRMVVGLVIIVALQRGLKLVFPDLAYWHLLRYFLMGFVGLGLWPWCFKKLKL